MSSIYVQPLELQLPDLTKRSTHEKLLVTAIECVPVKVGVKENTCSSPGVPQGPGGFQEPDPERLNVPVLPHDNELMLVHGFAGGAPPVTRVALSVIQLL